MTDPTRTVTDEQWEVIRDAASEHAAELEDRMCEACKRDPNPHRGCKDKEDDANEIRRVLAEVEGGRDASQA